MKATITPVVMFEC